ncbi:hypothetical protein [Roseiconus lacunae]|uniref:Uncharacterized protein n=1 Tax=Roseiconus lacunae TaxID=2605694 RepID=A0ABT7PLY1_9BACT|nr:hypothetical protein [Roseiconus lacunae]MDM4017161.1 hypothetical protein [Roseiconus lacunae]
MSFDVAGISRFFYALAPSGAHRNGDHAVLPGYVTRLVSVAERLLNGCDHGSRSTVRTVDRLV